MPGQSAIVDDVVTEGQAAEWRETADRFSARRIRGIPGWNNIRRVLDYIAAPASGE
jgi:hypothetical protein